MMFFEERGDEAEGAEPSRRDGRGESASPGGGGSHARARLEARGVRPTKTLGQNFLSDPNLAAAIVRDAGVGAGDRVLEVGIGCGFLTEPLARLGVELLAVEIDERLIEICRERLTEYPAVRLLHSDVLGGKHSLAEPVREALWEADAWHLVANLPYNISGPLAAILAGLDNPPQSMTILVQAEMAERLAARVGTGAWGALSARIQLLYRARLGREVGAQLFWPRPKVRSRIARLDLKPGTRPSPADRVAFNRLLDGLFQRRRKTVLTGLGAMLGDRERAKAALEAAGVDPRARPEELSPASVIMLARALH